MEKHASYKKVNKDNINYHNCKAFFFIASLFLSTILSSYFLFSILDEIIVILMIFNLFYSFLMSNTKKDIFFIPLLLFLLAVFGIISNILSGVERSVTEILIDILTISKPFIVFAYFFQNKNKINVYSLRFKLGIVAKILLNSFFCFLIFNILGLFNIGNNATGLSNFTLFGFAANFGILVFSLLGLVLKDSENLFSQWYFVLSTILILFTMKAQSIFFISLFALLYLVYKLNNKKIKFRWMIVSVLAILPLVWNKIVDYFITTSYSPRKIFMIDAFLLFKEYFPFGSGFATFGSPIASQSFSPIYIRMGYYNYYGMGENGDTQFLNDNFLSSIIGQLGFVGIFLFIILFFKVLNTINFKDKNSVITIFNLSGFFSLFATTLASSFFSGPVGSLLVAVIAVNYIYQTSDKEQL